MYSNDAKADILFVQESKKNHFKSFLFKIYLMYHSSEKAKGNVMEEEKLDHSQNAAKTRGQVVTGRRDQGSN